MITNKFKAWDKVNKTWILTRSGGKSLNSKTGKLEYIYGKTFTLHDWETCRLIGAFPGNYIIVNFIGLIDKNGVEIYENDIIIDSTSVDKKPWEIVWHEENSGWGSGDGTKTPYKSLENSFEVIGNKFENKELLK